LLLDGGLPLLRYLIGATRVITPKYDNQIGFSKTTSNFTPPLLTRLDVINVLEDEGLVNAQEFDDRRNQ
jgi:hypothetical protein